MGWDLGKYTQNEGHKLIKVHTMHKLDKGEGYTVHQPIQG